MVMTKIFATGLFTAVIALCLGSQTGTTVTAAEASKALFLRNCARCHGADGKAQTKLGQSLGAADLTSGDVKEMNNGEIRRIITRGRGDMPAFGKRLTARQIGSIAEYVRSL